MSKTILSYLTYEQYTALGTERPVGVVLLDQPLNRYLALAGVLVEGARIGTLVSEDQGLAYFEDRLAESRFQNVRSAAPKKLLNNLRDILSDIDIFLMTPNRELYNRNSLRGILLTAYRAGKPVISFSPSHVKSGALGSIFSSPSDIGRHLAELINELSTEPGPDKTRVEFARYFSVATNNKVARSLGLELLDDETIMRQLREVLGQ